MKKLVLLLGLVLAFITISACGSGEETVARVGDLSVGYNELKDALHDQFPHSEDLSEVELQQKLSVLDKMVLRKLKLNEAHDLGLDERPLFQKDVALREIYIITNKYWQHAGVDPVFPDTMLMKIYKRMKERRKTRHILISFRGADRSKSRRSKAAADSIINALAVKIKAGDDFASLAKQYSEDKESAEEGGSLEAFSWGRMEPAFEDAAYNMQPGEISEPVLTSRGYHLILLEEISKNEDFSGGSFEKEKANIQQALSLKYPEKRRDINRTWQKHLADKKKELSFKPDYSVRDSLLAFNMKQPGDVSFSMDIYDPEMLENVLVSWEGNTFTVQDFLGFYLDRLDRQRAMLVSQVGLDQEIDRLATAMFVYDLAREIGLDKDPGVQKTVRRYKEMSLLQDIEKIRVRDSVSYSEEDLKEYYINHKEEFTVPARMEMWEIYVTDENLAKNIYEKAKAGQDFEQLAVRYTEDAVMKKRKGFLGSVQENQFGEVSRTAFAEGENTVFGPLRRRDGWVVGKTGERAEPVIRSFEDVYKTLQRRTGYEKVRLLSQMWEKELRQSYDVEIDTQKVAEM